MNVLIACEFKGYVRDAFIKQGHNAISCDLEPTERPGPHIQKNVLSVLNQDWDLIIAHPPCTYLCNSGVRWLYEREGRWEQMQKACDFFNMFKNHSSKWVIENPIPHRYARELIGPYTQIIQPWQFGHGETKATCLWINGLPELKPSKIVEGRKQRIAQMPPGRDRGKLRSVTYPGIAAAMAEQWG